ncbi:hypothetical protein [Streptomyces sp. NPDC053079]|uniref:hypothetical protein n=1 Tax=Streptomyces sp. NPDC053079 TaxID=3365697 RepID=UPI0037D28FB2
MQNLTVASEIASEHADPQQRPATWPTAITPATAEMRALDVFLGIHGVLKVEAGPGADLLGGVPLHVELEGRPVLIVPPGLPAVETLLHARRTLAPEATQAVDQAVEQLDDLIAASEGDQAELYRIVRSLVIRTGDPAGVTSRVRELFSLAEAEAAQ